MESVEWTSAHVELASEKSHGLAEACKRLTDFGWTPRFVVPLQPNKFHILATRPLRQLTEPSSTPGAAKEPLHRVATPLPESALPSRRKV
jgi:hypothetical protein